MSNDESKDLKPYEYVENGELKEWNDCGKQCWCNSSELRRYRHKISKYVRVLNRVVEMLCDATYKLNLGEVDHSQIDAQANLASELIQLMIRHLSADDKRSHILYSTYRPVSAITTSNGELHYTSSGPLEFRVKDGDSEEFATNPKSE